MAVFNGTEAMFNKPLTRFPPPRTAPNPPAAPVFFININKNLLVRGGCFNLLSL